MSTQSLQSSAYAFDRFAIAALAAAIGVGLLSIVAVGFTPAPRGLALATAAAQSCLQPAALPNAPANVSMITR